MAARSTPSTSARCSKSTTKTLAAWDWPGTWTLTAPWAWSPSRLWPTRNLPERAAIESVCRGCGVGEIALEVRSESAAGPGNQWFVFRAHERRRRGLERQGLRGHGRLPADRY